MSRDTLLAMGDAPWRRESEHGFCISTRQHFATDDGKSDKRAINLAKLIARVALRFRRHYLFIADADSSFRRASKANCRLRNNSSSTLSFVSGDCRNSCSSCAFFLSVIASVSWPRRPFSTAVIASLAGLVPLISVVSTV